ncbi:MAG: hypothetical protein Q8O40_01610 [Chloroflexota bacterium]|nr:hypothetical protein [Chloroflexota bacterium]
MAELTQGMGTEDKSIFDVLVAARAPSRLLIGLSCKMRKELSRVGRDGRVTIELSNSSKKMWECLKELGISEANYKVHADKVGCGLVNLIKQWHGVAGRYRGKAVDIARSSYLVLLWDKKTGKYQLYRYPLVLPDPSTLDWYFPADKTGSGAAGHLNGDDTSGGRVFEWYGESGGQLKYYPLASDAAWQSPVFMLEPIPTVPRAVIGEKAAEYFPELWKAALAR